VTWSPDSAGVKYQPAAISMMTINKLSFPAFATVTSQQISPTDERTTRAHGAEIGQHSADDDVSRPRHRRLAG
jgi:hypothetical protein